MPSLALIHTSPVLVPQFQRLGAQLLEGVRLFNMVDESLIQETIRTGHLQKSVVRRLISLVDSAVSAGADAVLVTCSSIGEGVPVARALYDVPVLRIDERMAERAVQQGSRVGVIATLRTTLEPTVSLLQNTAARLGQPADVTAVLCDGAFEAMHRGDTETHDRVVAERILGLIPAVDAIVLAQASMARVAAQIPPERLTVPVLSSPELAMRQAAELLGGRAVGSHGA